MFQKSRTLLLLYIFGGFDKIPSNTPLPILKNAAELRKITGVKYPVSYRSVTATENSILVEALEFTEVPQ